MTQRAAETGGLNFRAIVELVARAEAELGDNEFRTSPRERSLTDPLSIRLVRVGCQQSSETPKQRRGSTRAGGYAPAHAFDRVNIVSDKEFFYDGSQR